MNLTHVVDRISKFAILLMLFSGFFLQGAYADFHEPDNRAIYKLPVIFSDAQVRVVSDGKLTQAEGHEIASVYKDALRFDLHELGWSEDGAVPKPLTIGILSPEYFVRVLHSDYGGEALENDLLVIKSKMFREERHRFWGVVAHELGHVLVWNLIAEPRQMGWSRSLDEGLALHLEEFYSLSKFKSDYPNGKIPCTRSDENFSAADAKWVFAHEKQVAKGVSDMTEEESIRWVNSVYPMGRQLIEFFRVHLKHSSNASTIQDLGKVIKSMAVSKSGFDDEFRKQFGVELADTDQQFILHLQDTQRNPQKRFANTIFRPRR